MAKTLCDFLSFAIRWEHRSSSHIFKYIPRDLLEQKKQWLSVLLTWSTSAAHCGVEQICRVPECSDRTWELSPESCLSRTVAPDGAVERVLRCGRAIVSAHPFELSDEQFRIDEALTGQTNYIG